MRSSILTKIAAVSTLGLVLLVAGSTDVNAQSRRDWEKEQKRYQKEQRKAAQEQQRWEREQTRRNGYGNYPVYNSPNTRYGGVYAPGTSHPAFQSGYQQGYQAGLADRRKGKYGRSNVYRSSGGAYPNAGDPTSTDYIYRQGYLQGYEDGYRR